MSTQIQLPFGKPKRHKPSPLVEFQRIRDQQLAVAQQIAAEPDAYCVGLQRWAELVIEHERCPQYWTKVA